MRIIPRTLALLALALSTPVHAQNSNVVAFKHFKAYPPGQWTTVSTSLRNGVALAPPQTQTVCGGGAVDDKTRESMMQMAKLAGATCRSTILQDSERLVEYEQVCPRGNTAQTMHVTMRAVDDRHMTTDTRMTLPGMPETLIHQESAYGGACTVAAKAASKPSAEDCAQLKEMAAQSNEGDAMCAQLPAAQRGTCVAQMAAGRQMTKTVLAQCP